MSGFSAPNCLMSPVLIRSPSRNSQRDVPSSVTFSFDFMGVERGFDKKSMRFFLIVFFSEWNSDLMGRHQHLWYLGVSERGVYPKRVILMGKWRAIGFGVPYFRTNPYVRIIWYHWCVLTQIKYDTWNLFQWTTLNFTGTNDLSANKCGFPVNVHWNRSTVWMVSIPIHKREDFSTNNPIVFVAPMTIQIFSQINACLWDFPIGCSSIYIYIPVYTYILITWLLMSWCIT